MNTNRSSQSGVADSMLAQAGLFRRVVDSVRLITPKQKKHMQRILLALALAALIVGPVAASETAEVMVPVRQFLDGFNKGDLKLMLAAGAEQMSILDEFPPYEWHGAGAFAKWMSDYDVDAQKNKITDGVVTFGKPRHVDVSGDRAYVVMPADYKYKLNGKPDGEVGSIITITLQKGPAGWRITGWAWAKH